MCVLGVIGVVRDQNGWFKGTYTNIPNSENYNEVTNNVVNKEVINGQDFVEVYFEGYDFDLEYGINDVFEWDVGLDNGQSFVKQKPNKKVVVEDPFEMPSDNEARSEVLIVGSQVPTKAHVACGIPTQGSQVGSKSTKHQSQTMPRAATQPAKSKPAIEGKQNQPSNKVIEEKEKGGNMERVGGSVTASSHMNDNQIG
ncbi:hypothetical protein JHK87_004862 [Glycine soja]|nr:hypothetical protein JHK87_004862 [Glycine soja]